MAPEERDEILRYLHYKTRNLSLEIYNKTEELDKLKEEKELLNRSYQLLREEFNETNNQIAIKSINEAINKLMND